MNSVTPMSTSSSSIPTPPRLPPRPSDREGENYEYQANNFVEEYVQFLDINSMIKINYRPMPITSRNELPHIKLTISCCNGDNAIGIKMLYDTGAALSTGFLDYHENIWKKHPKVVARYEKFDGDNPFDPIKLCGSINNPKDYDESKHGLLSAVIEYYTPYKYSDGSAFTLTLALGVGMAVNSILGLPAIIEGEIEPKWKQNIYLSHAFKAKFPIAFQQTTRSQVTESSNVLVLRNKDNHNDNMSPLNTSAHFRSVFSDCSNVNADESTSND